MSAPYYSDDAVTLWHGDCLAVMAEMPDCSVDSVVTDPPYGLGFMGRAWDSLPPGAEFAAECLRVLKPGGHMVAFGGSRTWHRLAVAVEDAGFEIRDSIAWLYASGFPKSMNVSKAIAATEMGHGGNSGAIRRATMGDDYIESGRLGNRDGAGRRDTGLDTHALTLTTNAEKWQGFGTALKPAFEPIVVGRKPLAGTVAANVLAHGTGALNVGACRVPGRVPGGGNGEGRSGGIMGKVVADVRPISAGHDNGRWPTNVVLDGSQAADLDAQTGILTSGAYPTHRRPDKSREVYGDFKGQAECEPARGADSGGASRFFPTFHYEAKAPTDERPNVDGIAHPTVKPLDLMRWLVRLVTPPGGTVLEPFAGSGTTAEACVIEGFKCHAIEREDTYLPLIVQRLSKPIQVGLDFGDAS